MIERYVFIRLKEEFQTADHRRKLVETALELRAIPGVRAVTAGVAADTHAQQGWDVNIAVLFDELDQVGPYLAHPEHRRFVDDYLKPRMKVIKYWNFEVSRVESVPAPD